MTNYRFIYIFFILLFFYAKGQGLISNDLSLKLMSISYVTDTSNNLLRVECMLHCTINKPTIIFLNASALNRVKVHKELTLMDLIMGSNFSYNLYVVFRDNTFKKIDPEYIYGNTILCSRRYKKYTLKKDTEFIISGNLFYLTYFKKFMEKNNLDINNIRYLRLEIVWNTNKYDFILNNIISTLKKYEIQGK